MQLNRPTSTDAALSLLAGADDECTVVAGGTAVMLMMRNGLLHPEHLLSLDRVPGLDTIDVTADEVRLGASVRLRDVELSPAVQSALPTLTGALSLVANHRVRRQATVGGLLCEADYASDPPSILVTLGCRVRLASLRGERWMPLSEFLVDYYTTAKEPDELLLEVVVPRPPSTVRTTYIKYVSRSSEDRPCVGIAAYLDTDGAGRCSDVRVAVAGATSTPFAVPEATEAVRGSAPDPALWRQVADAYRDAIAPIGDIRGSAAYRKHVVGELVRRALQSVGSAGTNGAMRL